jgi:hypothetical protein
MCDEQLWAMKLAMLSAAANHVAPETCTFPLTAGIKTKGLSSHCCGHQQVVISSTLVIRSVVISTMVISIV